MTIKKWKIFIAAHNGVHDRMYAKDKNFNAQNYVVLNVAQQEFDVSSKYSLIHQFKLQNFTSLGKWWAESEGIYNVWKNNLHKGLDFIGFLHYDKEFRLINKPFYFLESRTNITDRINHCIHDKTHAHISFETHIPQKDYKQRIMADVTMPNTLVGDGLNCYDYILADYNHYFKTNYSIEDFINKPSINLCSCFLIDTPTFEKMMGFFDWIVTSKKLDVFDTKHQYRLQGGLAERYFGLFLSFEYGTMCDLSIAHQYNKNLK